MRTVLRAPSFLSIESSARSSLFGIYSLLISQELSLMNIEDFFRHSLSYVSRSGQVTLPLVVVRAASMGSVCSTST